MVDAGQGIPQADELPLHHIVMLAAGLPVADGRAALPQVGIVAGVKKGSEQVLAKDFLDLFQHLGREVIAAQPVQVIKVAIDVIGIG